MTDGVRALLAEAAAAYRGSDWEQRLRAAADDLDAPLRVALVGRVKAGKSTLLNALVGQQVAATDARECTRVVTWYLRGAEASAVGIRAADGEPVPLALRSPGSAGDGSKAAPAPGGGSDAGRAPGGDLTVDLDGVDPADLTRIEVRLPNPVLDGLVLVDTPGMGSLRAELGERARRALAGGDGGAPPDAVLYLMRRLHSTDVDLLEAFRDPIAASTSPVHAIGVLSRADEVGGGRADALDVARQVADGYAEDPRLRPLVQAVLPVSGLVGEAAATLAEAEVDALAALAALPVSVTDGLLLSAARFTAPRRKLQPPPEVRWLLLERLGLVGIRWALAELRRGELDGEARPQRERLAAALSQASGLTALRSVLRTRVTGRREILKTDTGLRLVLQALAVDPVAGARRLAAAVEQVRLGLHEVAELRLLEDLRVAALSVPDGERTAMEALLGASGGDARSRLRLTAEAAEPEVRAALLAAHGHWARLSADPLTAPDVARAAAVLQRTCEGLWRELDRAPEPSR